MNQAVQQRKVASIVSQLQTPNTGSAPNLAMPQTSTLKQESIDKVKNIQNNTDLVTFDDVIIHYSNDIVCIILT